MSAGDPIGVGVIGLGFTGHTHIAAYRAAAAAGRPNRLVAVCDTNPERRTGLAGPAGNIASAGESPRSFDPAEVSTYADPAELLADDSVDLVSVCTYTDTHVDLALRALAARKHVLVEKPVATALADVERLAEAARASDRLCMPALCIRFWPGWTWLRGRILDRSLGAVRSATFQRLGAMPTWSPIFYADLERSGGALMDLHVHDADFVRHCFGDPAAVSSTGSLHHVTTLYRFDDGPEHVVAEGGWDHAPGFGFTMGYTVAFEHATASWVFGRSPELLLARETSSEAVELDPITGYEGEVRHLLDAIARGGSTLATIDDAVGHTRLLEAERRSLESGTTVAL